MKFTNLDRLLPFGYLILVVLGIIKESVFYYQIGINILKYSSIMDILISPIADLTSHPIILSGCAIYIILMFLGFVYASKHPEKMWFKKLIDIKENDPDLTKDEIKIRLGNKFLSTIAMCVMFFFLGIGLGNGGIISKKIAEKKIKYNSIFTFDTNEKKQVYIIGSNSMNYFYVEKGNNNVQISPVGAIKSVEILKK